MRAGVPLDCIDSPAPDATQFDSESLWQQVATQVRAGDRILIVRGCSEGAEPGPGIGRDCEYVLDMDLAEYGIRHFESTADNICHSVLLSDGRYTMVDRIFGELFYKPIESLETAALFKKVT